MLGSMSPVGDRSRNQRWWITAIAYTVASVVAAAVMGVGLGAAGQVLAGIVRVPAAMRLLVLGTMLIAAAALDAGARGRLPTWRRQVDERWLTTYRGWVYGAGFGAQLGLGVATIVTSAATYATLAAAFLSASWHKGLLIGVVFGAARATPLLLMARVRSADRLYAVTRKVAAGGQRVHRLTIAGQGVLGAVVLTTAISA
jgi:sulfite exporter TauE/SafE